MAKKDAFTGAKTASLTLCAFANVVAKEIGMERTLGLITKTCEAMGAMQGKMMKQQAGTKEIDAKAAWSLLRSVSEDLGVTFPVVEESPKRVFIKSGRCPLYEAAQALGMDAKSIEAGCRAGSNRFDDVLVKQLNPGLSFRLMKFRSAADDFCEEELVLG